MSFCVENIAILGLLLVGPGQQTNSPSAADPIEDLDWIRRADTVVRLGTTDWLDTRLE